MADVDQLKQVHLAPVSNPLLKRADVLHELAHHGEVLLGKHIVGQQHLLSACKQPTHEIDSMVNVTGEHVKFLFQLPQCGFFGPLLHHPRRLDVAQHGLRIPGFDQEFILG